MARSSQGSYLGRLSDSARDSTTCPAECARISTGLLRKFRAGKVFFVYIGQAGDAFIEENARARAISCYR